MAAARAYPGLRAGPAVSSPRLRAGGSTATASGPTFRERRVAVRTRAGLKGRFEVFDGRSRDDDAVLDADALPATCALPLNIDTSGDVPYSEASRRYRRTVFTNEDWLQHRSSTRLFGNLSGTFTSGVVRSLVTEVAAVATIGALACAWNGAIEGFEDFGDVLHAPLLPNVHDVFLARLPALPFTLASPALGLLLVFRTNASYARWVESRVAWGRIVSHCRNVMRQSALWMNADVEVKDKQKALHRVRCAAWAFPRCLASRLSGPEDERALCVALETRLDSVAASRLLRAPNRPLQALADLSAAMNALPIDEKRRVEMDKSVILLGDALETCERIFTSPVPLVYTRHTARFLSCWLLLLPLALWEPFGTSWNHVAVVPATTLVAIFFFGIEELAVQLEEPFSILPLSKLCDSVWDAGVELFQDPEPVMASGMINGDAVEMARSDARS
jgi:predicted membrane chloride channel (bestrophin family)